VPALTADALHRFELIREERLRIKEETPDQRALPIVNRAGGCEPEKVGLHQK
jgi:hypothetical protein